MRISILPMGEVEGDILSHLEGDLRGSGLEVNLLPRREVPEGAFNRRREQYRATAFIELARRASADRILVVTDVDIYADPLNFVFGQAEVGGWASVISIHRLGNDGPELLRERALKEALHEIGHNRGIGHCPDRNCVMFFSNNLEDTDRKGNQLCSDCQAKLEPLRG